QVDLPGTKSLGGRCGIAQTLSSISTRPVVGGLSQREFPRPVTGIRTHLATQLVHSATQVEISVSGEVGFGLNETRPCCVDVAAVGRDLGAHDQCLGS